MNGRIPLHYAIIEHFLQGVEDDASGVVTALASDYASYKMLTESDVEEALMTAKENGILEETRCEADQAGNPVVFYRMTDFGARMVERYL